MNSFLRILALIFSRSVIEKLIALVFLFATLIVLKDFLALFFITFLFAYIFLELGELFADKLHTWGSTGKRDTPHKIASKYATTNRMVTLLYIIFVGIVIFIFSNILPQIGSEVKKFLQSAPTIAFQAQDFIRKIEDSTNLNLGLDTIA